MVFEILKNDKCSSNSRVVLLTSLNALFSISMALFNPFLCIVIVWHCYGIAIEFEILKNEKCSNNFQMLFFTSLHGLLFSVNVALFNPFLCIAIVWHCNGIAIVWQCYGIAIEFEIFKNDKFSSNSQMVLFTSLTALFSVNVALFNPY